LEFSAEKFFDDLILELFQNKKMQMDFSPQESNSLAGILFLRRDNLAKK